jgi:hypothetical protein
VCNLRTQFEESSYSYQDHSSSAHLYTTLEEHLHYLSVCLARMSNGVILKERNELGVIQYKFICGTAGNYLNLKSELVTVSQWIDKKG